VTPGVGDYQIIIKAKAPLKAFAKLEAIMDRGLVTPPRWATEDYIRQELQSSEIDALFAEAEVSMWQHELERARGWVTMCQFAATRWRGL